MGCRGRDSMVPDTGGRARTGPVRPTRRRYLRLAGLGTAVAAGGCVSGDGGDGSTARPGETAGAPSTLLNTWRGGDPATATTLQWVTDAGESPPPVALRLVPPAGKTVAVETDVERFSSPASYTQVFRHRAVVDGLAPDTRYRVHLDGTDTGLSIRTAPAELTDPLVFAEGGDVGTSSAVPELHDRAAGWDPLFAFVGGDLAYADAVSVRDWLTFLEQWHAGMRAGDRLIPIVAAVGNHEVAGGMHGDPADAPFFYALFDNRRRDHAYWALDIGESVSLVILDSNHTTEVPGAQTDWLDRALADRRDRRHLLAAYHVPAYPSAKPIRGAGRDRQDVREQWVPLFEAHGVDVAFEHDDHTYKRTHLLAGGDPDPDGVLYVGDGAWGRGPRTAKPPAERPYLAESASSLNVVRVELSPDGSGRFRAVDPDGNTIDRFDGRGTDLGSPVSRPVSGPDLG